MAEGQPGEERNVAFTIEIGGINVCHLGDIAVQFERRMVDELKPVDVVLIPTGGHCTLDMDQAYQTLQDLDAKIAIPMHYKTDGLTVDIDPTDNFVRRMGLDEVQPQPRLVVTSSNLGTDLRTDREDPGPRFVARIR